MLRTECLRWNEGTFQKNEKKNQKQKNNQRVTQEYHYNTIVS